jgi:hypothetical protein
VGVCVAFLEQLQACLIEFFYTNEFFLDEIQL